MKKVSKVIMGLVLIVGLGSCGVNNAWILNQNQNTTQVHLGSNNFEVVGQVKGTAQVNYVLIFGGKNKTQLYYEAYNAMTEKAKLTSGSRTLTNILTEEHVGGFPPFAFKRTLTVSANVIQFTE
jgi:hypothetical protein